MRSGLFSPSAYLYLAPPHSIVPTDTPPSTEDSPSVTEVSGSRPRSCAEIESIPQTFSTIRLPLVSAGFFGDEFGIAVIIRMAATVIEEIISVLNFERLA
jgi:hypothetical protein